MKGCIRALATLMLFAAQSAPAQKARDFTPYLTANRAAEMALARTAAPAAITDSATVLVLTRTGFVEAALGTNGMKCMVLRSFTGAPSNPIVWNPRVQAPICFNPPAARTVLTSVLMQAKWLLSGATPADVATRRARAYASHDFPLPAPGAMAFMLSPKQYLVDEDPHWHPHLMFFYDRTQPSSAWGAHVDGSPLIDDTGADSTQGVLTLLIPVPNWSDGKPAVSAKGR